MLNKRITKRIEENEITGGEQACFRQDHSTFDHIFYSFSFSPETATEAQKLYVAFVDFRKAFDRICRTKLWNVLHRSGLRGKIAIALQNVYAIVKA